MYIVIFEIFIEIFKNALLFWASLWPPKLYENGK